jgi:hypothetical protein
MINIEFQFKKISWNNFTDECSFSFAWAQLIDKNEPKQSIKHLFNVEV